MLVSVLPLAVSCHHVQGVSRELQDSQARTGAVHIVDVTAVVELAEIGKSRVPAIIRIALERPELVVANQNAGLPINGDIRVFDEGQGGAPIAVLVPDSHKKAPSAPFGILLYGNSLLIADEAGQVEVFDVTKTPARFAGNLDTTSYNPAVRPRRRPGDRR